MSIISTVTSAAILGVLVSTRAVAAGWANVIATGVGTIPSFELNRRWVWRKQGKRSIWTEVGPFAALSFAGLGLSTLAVSTAARWADHTGLDRMTRTMAVEAASLIAFGALWVLQFLILEHLLFGPKRGGVGGGVTEGIRTPDIRDHNAAL